VTLREIGRMNGGEQIEHARNPLVPEGGLDNVRGRAKIPKISGKFCPLVVAAGHYRIYESHSRRRQPPR